MDLESGCAIEAEKKLSPVEGGRGAGRFLFKHKDYQRVYQQRQCLDFPFFQVYFALAPDGMTRMGLAVPRRSGKAVQRNWCKRILREFYRHYQHDTPQGVWFVVVVHKPIHKDFLQWKRQFLEALKGLKQWVK